MKSKLVMFFVLHLTFSTYALAEISIVLKKGEYIPYISLFSNKNNTVPAPFAIFCMVEDEILKQKVKEQNPYFAALKQLGSTKDVNEVVSWIDFKGPDKITTRAAPDNNNLIEISCAN